jgi:hypothetical protein
MIARYRTPGIFKQKIKEPHRRAEIYEGRTEHAILLNAAILNCTCGIHENALRITHPPQNRTRLCNHKITRAKTRNQNCDLRVQLIGLFKKLVTKENRVAPSAILQQNECSNKAIVDMRSKKSDASFRFTVAAGAALLLSQANICYKGHREGPSSLAHMPNSCKPKGTELFPIAPTVLPAILHCLLLRFHGCRPLAHLLLVLLLLRSFHPR